MPDSVVEVLSQLRQEEDAEKRLQGLARASERSEVGVVEAMQIDRLLGDTRQEPDNFAEVRLAVLASCTVEHLLPAIRIAGLPYGKRIRTFTPPYGQFRTSLLTPSGELSRFDPHVVVLSLHLGALLPPLDLDRAEDEVAQVVRDAARDLQSMWRMIRKKFGATVIQQTFLDVSEPLFGSFDRLVPAAPFSMADQLNREVAEAARQHGVHILDIARELVHDGRDAWYEHGRWLHGKMEIAPKAAVRYGRLLGRVIGAQMGQSRKCLVLDLDNTVWGGVVGDDGIDGITLGEGSGVGEAHLGLQKYAKALKDRGVILAICSKNEHEVAERAFRSHPEMHLSLDDIAVFQANWDDKAQNILTIASRLNIGADSLVFVDDNPAERARVREALPDVAVPDLPPDPADWVRFIARQGYFEAVAFTKEDRERARQYAENAERAELLESAQSVDDFLRDLEMRVSFGPIQPVDRTRSAQLINKTNQFNTTTRRMTQEELDSFVASTGNHTLQFRLTDRFGDNGLVSVLLLRPDTDQPDVLRIENWVMSCRVFGRKLEDEALNAVVEIAKRNGYSEVRAELIPTEKNGVIQDLFDRLGFTRLTDKDPSKDASLWSLPVDDYRPRPTPIQRQENHQDD